uniref:Uncharacterized protein n=1 Tax=Lepeophtheirus salmonis TaxID=72036 RepID=A0A0K2TGR0_LEPSM
MVKVNLTKVSALQDFRCLVSYS